MCVGESGTGAFRTVGAAFDFDVEEVEAKEGTASVLLLQVDDVGLTRAAPDASPATRGRGASTERGATGLLSDGSRRATTDGGDEEGGPRSSDEGSACLQLDGRMGEDEVGVA